MALPAEGPLWYLRQHGSSGWEQNPPQNRAHGPTGTPHLGERARRIHRDPGVLAGESWMGPDVRQLASAFSALYPKDSEEKRLVDAMLLAMPR
jgi:hypothetical protein